MRCRNTDRNGIEADAAVVIPVISHHHVTQRDAFVAALFVARDRLLGKPGLEALARLDLDETKRVFRIARDDVRLPEATEPIALDDRVPARLEVAHGRLFAFPAEFLT